MNYKEFYFQTIHSGWLTRLSALGIFPHLHNIGMRALFRGVSARPCLSKEMAIDCRAFKPLRSTPQRDRNDDRDTRMDH